MVASLILYQMKESEYERPGFNNLGWEDPPEECKANQSSILAWRIPTDRGAWQARVHRLAKGRTGLKRLSTQHMMLRWDRGKVLVVKNPPPSAEDIQRCRFNPWVGKIPWRRAWQPTPVFFPGESPRTEEPGRLYSSCRSWTQLSN